VSGQNEDAVWADIIANYGDRPLLDEPVIDETVVEQGGEEPGTASARREPLPEPRSERPVVPSEPDRHPELDGGWLEERFVPPPPPPLPRLPKDRLAAWAGVFLSPLLLLLATLLQVRLPAMVAWLLVGAFLGGFGYLVAQMPRGPRDPFDDGAVL
jgi:hypothetical protein